jgi:membrane peptidoglycan carboxypeptidase
LGLGCGALVSLILVLGIILTAFTYARLTRDLPSVEVLPALLEPPEGRLLQPTRLYDRSGQHVLLVLQHPGAANHQFLRLSPGEQGEIAIPEELITATLAAADPQFWNHNGAPLSSLLRGERSTLAKRLATDILLGNEPSGLRRVLRSHLLGLQITARFGRETVLEWYLNSANYGRLAYGADAASLVYFGMPASELGLPEAAMLAAAAEAPDLNPMDAPQAALEQQKRIIQNMLRYRMITPDEGVEAARKTLVFRDPERQGQALSIQELEPDLAHAFARLALMQLETQIGWRRLERGGLRIVTSLDYDLQTQALCLAQVQQSRLTGTSSQTSGEEPECEAARLLPTLSEIPARSDDDLPTLGTLSEIKTDIVVLDPLNGQIMALVGQPPIGPEVAGLEDHPAGSLVTPFIYLTAFTRGLSPASLVWDIPAETQVQGEAFIDVQNFDNQYHGPMRLRIALANDYLVPAKKVLTQVGADNVRRTLRQFALAPPDPPVTVDRSPLQLLEQVDLVSASQAFGVFANRGVLAGRVLCDECIELRDLQGSPAPLHPVSVLQVQDADGQTLLDWRVPQERPIITSQLAYLMTDALSDEPARWPSLGHPNSLEVGRDAAAKISRTYELESYWAIGYIPQMVVGVWLGSAQEGLAPEPEARASISNQVCTEAACIEAVAGLWHATLQYASRNLPYQTWEMPSGITLMEVCDPSGQLPTKSCPNTVTEVFLSGNEPVQGDTLYHAVAINSETNRLASVFTAPELVEERVYLSIPPEATLWAAEAELETPPQNYDTIPASLPDYTHAFIEKPAMFSLVRGRIDISGAAGGQDFKFYRVQVGKGMYPTEWFQIGQDVTLATTGQLASWDTRGLNGLYTIQLLIAKVDQSVERVNLLVTVDNQPPQVRIVAPVNGTFIDLDQGSKIVLRAEVQDEIGIQSVSFYVDDTLLDTLIQPPYAISWSLEEGEHHLRLSAVDHAGNTSEDDITFVVE